MLLDRDEFLAEEVVLWLRTTMWFQITYSMYCDQVQEYVEASGVNLEQIERCSKDPASAPIHGPPFMFDEAFMQKLEVNKQDALQPGVSRSNRAPVDDPDGLLEDMPEDMAHRHQEWSRKPAVVSDPLQIEGELLKRFQVADLKFLLQKKQKPAHGNKANLLRRLLVTKTEDWGLDPHDLGPASEFIGALYFVTVQQEPPALLPVDEAVDEAVPAHAHAPVGQAADPERMNEIMECILEVGKERLSTDPPLVYFYIDDQGRQMVEVHKDLVEIDPNDPKLPPADRRALQAFGGKFSVRFTPNAEPYDRCPYGIHDRGVCKCHKPLLMSGQDESAFKSFAQSNMEWTLGHDEGKVITGMRKKGEGNGWMVSAFQDEAHGFGLPMSLDSLQEANEILQSRGMPPLSMSPGVRTLEYGKNKEGYWTMQDMVKQLKEVLVCQEVLYPGVQICHLFDWSAGHSAMPPLALMANQMNATYGGKQSKMRPTKIIAEDGFLGPYPRRLNVGDTQQMVFQAGDDPPWYALAAPQHDREDLQSDGTKKLIQGYIGKPKGLKQVRLVRDQRVECCMLCPYSEVKTNLYMRSSLQVLWERGLLDEANPPKVEEQQKIMAKCFDFVHEKTALENLCHEGGHLLRMTPKGHPELAGVGIEYSWGKAKQYYRRHNSLDPKLFHNEVLHALSTEVLFLERVRKFSRRARNYMRAYKGGNTTFSDVEKQMKNTKVHRSALDFDGGWIRNCDDNTTPLSF